MQKNKKRKGFTLTELAIVIAVIAILIAVLVPTFVSLINKANESADEQAVKSMNTALAADEALNGKKTNPSEAMQVLIDAGYNVENYQALDSNNVIYWNSETNRTLLYSTSENAVIYPSDAASTYTNLVADNLPNYWYTLSKAYSTTQFETTATTTAEVTTAFVNALKDLDEGETLQLTSDITLNSSSTSSTLSNLSASGVASKEIDLNGYTLTDSGCVKLEEGASLTIRNGTYVETSITSNTSSNFNITKNSSVTLDGVTLNVCGSGLYPQGNSAQVNVINSTISSTGAYCVGTNAATVTNYGVIINLSNSTFSAANKKENYDSCVVMINVEGTLNIDNCVINGERQGVVVRAGTANITNTTINCNVGSSKITDDFSKKTNMTYPGDYDSKTGTNNGKVWGSGNEVAMGAVVVGNNQNGAYLADAVVTMSGCTISYTVDNKTDSQYAIALFMVANNKNTDSETNVTTYYKTSVTVSDCTLSGKVIDFDSSSTNYTESDSGCTSTLTGYTADYTKWNGTAWE